MNPLSSSLIFHLNCNSFRGKKAEIINHIQEIRPIAICFSELKCQAAPIIKDYYSYKPSFPTRPYQGGSAIYIQSNVDSELISRSWHSNSEIIGVKIKLKTLTLTLFHAYFPPSLPPSSSDLDYINQVSGPTLFIGDLNAHSPDLSFRTFSNETGRLLSNFIASSSFSILNDSSPTHHCSTPGLSYRLDLALGNAQFLPLFQDFTIGEDLGSDHMPILISCSFSHPRPNINGNPQFDFCKADWFKFQETVETLLPDPSPIINVEQLDEAVTLITEVIQIAQELSIPKKSLSSKPYNLSPFTLSKIRERRKLRRAFHHSKNNDLKPVINKLNHEIKALLKAESAQYWSNFCEQLNSEEDPANFWKLFRRVGNPRNNQSKPLKYMDGTHCTDESKASVFARTLQEAMTEPPSLLGSNAPISSRNLEADIKNFSFYNPSLSFSSELSESQELLIKEISLEEILTAVKNSPNKAPGPDNIFIPSVKHLPEPAFLALHSIFNACLSLGHVPLLWKTANITMIPKPEKDLSDPSSYRPISLLSVLQKLLERIITDRLHLYLETNLLLSPSQSGFRRNLCTTDQVVRVHHDALQAVHHRKHLAALFFDVTKAFDRVWHAGLLYNFIFISIFL